MSVQEDWMERPFDEVLTTTGGEGAHNSNFEDTSSTLTPNTWEDDLYYAETEVLVVTDVVPLPLDYVVNDDDEMVMDGIATRIFPGEVLPVVCGKKVLLHFSWRRASVSVSFGAALLMALVSMTPSLCSRLTIGDSSNSRSFCLATVVRPDPASSNDKSALEVKMLDFVSSISLAGNVDTSIVDAILRRGDLELPWDADRIRQRYAVGTLLGSAFVARYDECGMISASHHDGDASISPAAAAAGVNIICDDEDLVTELRLTGAKLKGTIPQDIGLLSNKLRVLDIMGNELTGTLPSRMVSVLTKLVYLDVSHNLLSGTIPDSLGSLKQLSHLSLADNAFSGPVPDSLCNLTRLRVLRLTRNQLSGKVPQCEWEDLEAVFIDGNQFSGPLPRTMPKLVRWNESHWSHAAV